MLLQPWSHTFSLSEMSTWKTIWWLLAKWSCDHSRKNIYLREILQILIVSRKVGSTKHSGFKYKQETRVSGFCCIQSLSQCFSSSIHHISFPIKAYQMKASHHLFVSMIYISKSRTWPRLHPLQKNDLPANHASCVFISLLYFYLFCRLGFFCLFFHG